VIAAGHQRYCFFKRLFAGPQKDAKHTLALATGGQVGLVFFIGLKTQQP
jgi:hypothetical protein